jgi:hypothetical protein
MDLRFRSVNLSGSPISGVGGLALVIFASLVTVVVPGAWWLLLASVIAGVMLGILTIAIRSGTSTPNAKSRPLSLHVR